MKAFYCLIFIIIGGFSYAQHKKFDIGHTYPVKEVIEDINYTEKYLLKFHPDPYRYISHDSLHAFIEGIKRNITEPLTEMQVRFYIKQIVAKIGCSHSGVDPSKAYSKTVKKLGRPVLPLNTYLLSDGRMIVINNLSNDSGIVVGDEIINIDGHPLDSVIRKIFSVITSDGYNETAKSVVSRYDNFKRYYSFCYGYNPYYTLTLKANSGNIYTCRVKSISTLKDTLILPKKDSVQFLESTKTCRYSVIENPQPIALIDIDAFSGRHWNRFFRRSFKDIRQKHIHNVVIDLRNNGGGKIRSGLKFLSYVINKPVKIPFDRKPNLIAFNPRMKMGVGRLIPIVFTFFAPNTFSNGRLRHYPFGFPKHKNAFKGNIYVLVNGRSFSMSAISSTYLKYKVNATIIGEETGGNIAGTNAIITGKLLLPHTHIGVFIPVYHVYHDIDVINDGHGLMPDYKTIYSKQDILQGIDQDIRKVKELVK